MLHGFFQFYILCSYYILSYNHPLFDFTHPTENEYATFPEWKRLQALEQSKRMFYFGYDNYMNFAFPKDELDPIHCTGRGPDYENPSNLNINDVLGDYALTLIESLDTLAIMGNTTEFKRAVKLVVENVSFNKASTVQVFEANIRVLGALLSAHLLITDPSHPFGKLATPAYNNELLHLARDLGHRLLSAFQSTNTGIPHPRVNLQTGVPKDSVNETCTAGAGTLRLEFGVLSHLLGDPSFELAAKMASDLLWKRRSNVTGLFGNVIDIQTGEWRGHMSGLGAGIDSFYEYLFKSFILFGDADDLIKFNQVLHHVKTYLRKGRKGCNIGTGFPPIHVNVNMNTGDLFNNWIDSLQAAWTSIQVLAGDIEEAICSHAFYYTIWLKYNALPERYNWLLKHPDVSFYPLRPEFIESTYFLYRATMNPFYLHIGLQVMHSIEEYNKARCGYATRHDVTTMELEDRMESFFLSETCKYLYLLFDEHNHMNTHSDKYLFTTEGHIFPILPLFQRPLHQRPPFKAPSNPYHYGHENEDGGDSFKRGADKRSSESDKNYDENHGKNSDNVNDKDLNRNKNPSTTNNNNNNKQKMTKNHDNHNLQNDPYSDPTKSSTLNTNPQSSNHHHHNLPHGFVGIDHAWTGFPQEYLNLMKITPPHSNASFKDNCQKQPSFLRYSLPIRLHYLEQMRQIIGV